MELYREWDGGEYFPILPSRGVNEVTKYIGISRAYLTLGIFDQGHYEIP